MGSLRSLLSESQKWNYEIVFNDAGHPAVCFDWSTVPEPCLGEAHRLAYRTITIGGKKIAPISSKYRNLFEIPSKYDSLAVYKWFDAEWKYHGDFIRLEKENNGKS